MAEQPPQPPEPHLSGPGNFPVPIPPAPLPAHPAERWKGVYWRPATYLRGHLFVHAAAFAAIGVSMLAQTERYTMDTNRGLAFALEWVSATSWGLVFLLLAAVKLAAGILYPQLGRLAIAAGILLTTWWTAGFAFSWLYDRATILGLVAWALVLGEHFAAATLFDGRRHWGEEWPPPRVEGP